MDGVKYKSVGVDVIGAAGDHAFSYQARGYCYDDGDREGWPSMIWFFLWVEIMRFAFLPVNFIIQDRAGFLSFSFSSQPVFLNKQTRGNNQTTAGICCRPVLWSSAKTRMLSDNNPAPPPPPLLRAGGPIIRSDPPHSDKIQET